MTLTVSVNGYTQNQFVSGTNQTFTVMVTATKDPNYTGSDAWTDIAATAATIKIGGSTVESWTPGGGGGAAVSSGGAEASMSTGSTQTLLKSFSVRWDSTNFASSKDNKPLTIECTADAQVWRSGEGPVPIGSSANPAKVDVAVVVYNYGFAGEIPFANQNFPTAGGVAGAMNTMNHYVPGGADYGTLQNYSYQAVKTSTAYYFNGDGRDSPCCFVDDAGRETTGDARTGSQDPRGHGHHSFWAIQQRGQRHLVPGHGAAVSTLARCSRPVWAACVLGVAILPAVCFAIERDQSWVPGPGATEEKLKPGPGEITVDKAVAVAQAFFPKLGLDVPPVVPSVTRITWKGKPGGDVSVVFGNEAALVVGAKTGQVWRYENLRRQSERWNRETSPGPQLIRDVLAARSNVFGVMKCIGMPDDCKLTKLECRFAGDPPGIGNDPGPQINAAFQPEPYGYRLRPWYDEREVEIDPADGAVIVYNLSTGVSYTIESRDVRVKLSQALALAAPVVEKYSVGKQGTGPFAPPVKPSAEPSELMFVFPDGELGGVEHDRSERPVRLRLAWVLHYSDRDEVFVDAADGRVLGGHTWEQDNLADAKAMKRANAGGP
jgi:hypothetical protein